MSTVPAPRPGSTPVRSATARAAAAPMSPAGSVPSSPLVQIADRPPAKKPSLLIRATSTTPRLFRTLLVLTALAAVLFGVFAQQTGALQARAAAEARAQSAQLVGVQEVRNLLVDANAVAANTFLVGGLEPAQQRQRYSTSLAEATSQLTALAAAEPADAPLLATVATKVAVYSGLVEQARANNRQGFPVGSAYLDQASAQLTDADDGILEDLESLVAQGADRVASAYDTVRFSVLLMIGSLVMLLVLIAAQIALARRTHRYLNRPLATATGLLLLLGIAGTGVYGVAASNAATVRSESYRATLAVSQALTAATDAKSLESFTLIKRGSGAALEADFQEAATEAERQLQRGIESGIVDGSLLSELQSWLTLHDGIRQADDEGRWDDAVALAVATEDGTANAAFTAFQVDARETVRTDAATASSTLGEWSSISSLTSWVLLAAGLVGAVLAWRGVSQRLEEYR